eukprot:2289133-Alexandrium_andersonii.AAC.1
MIHAWTSTNPNPSYRPTLPGRWPTSANLKQSESGGREHERVGDRLSERASGERVSERTTFGTLYLSFARTTAPGLETFAN